MNTYDGYRPPPVDHPPLALDRVYRIPLIFPMNEAKNVVICTTAAGNRDSFSVFISDLIPDVHMSDKSSASQCFPLYLYEKADDSGGVQFDKSEVTDGYRRQDAITLLNPAVVEQALALAEAEIVDGGAARRWAALAAELAKLDTEVERLMMAIKRGGDLDPLLAALRESDARRRTPPADSSD